MKKVDQYRNETNQIIKQLELENKVYFEKLVRYMTTAGFFYDETEVHEQISQLAADLLNAQENGESAFDFFGSQPKAMADELIKNFAKKSYKKQIQATALVTLIVLVLNYATYLGTEPFRINLLEYGALTVLMLVLLSVFFSLFHRLTYLSPSTWLQKIKNNALLSFFLIWLASVFCIGGLALAVIGLREISWYSHLTVTLTPPFEWLFLLMILAILTGIVVAKKLEILYYVLPILYLSTLSGAVKVLFFSNEMTIAAIVVPFGIMGLAILTYLFLLTWRKKKKTDSN